VKRVLATLACTGLLVAGAAPALAHPAPPGQEDPERRLLNRVRRAAERATAGRPAGVDVAFTQRFEVVGHTDLGGDGFNADVWGHDGYAYVGIWGTRPGSGGCPASGVKVIDLSDPTHPTVVSVLQNPPKTTAEDVVVRSVATPSFTGDLAVVGIQDCKGWAFQGLQLFDVTDPESPVELGRWRAPDATTGCHEVDLVQRASDGRVLAGCSNPFAEQSFHGPRGDEVVLVDATRPTALRKAGGWRFYGDRGRVPRVDGVGCFGASFNHSVRFADAGETLFASYWDAGTVNLDVSHPADPIPVGRARIVPRDGDGDSHSMTLAFGGEVLIVNPEDFCPGGRPRGWGQAHVFSNEDPGHTRELSVFSTWRSRRNRFDGIYTIHNTEVVLEDQAFSSWYSDGIVWWDLSDPRNPVRLGQFRPPPAPDPHGVFPNAPMVWGVYPDPDSDLILASDINSGLWVLRPQGMGGF
jgi:hypothetical protein